MCNKLFRLDELVSDDGSSDQLQLHDSTIFQKLTDTRRRRLYIKTPVLICQSGIEDNNRIRLELSAAFIAKLQHLEKWITEHLDKKITEDLDNDDCYRSLIKTDSAGTEHLNVFIDNRSKIFDRDNQEIPGDKYHEFMTGYFKCMLVLELSKLAVFANKVQINPHVFQLKVISFSVLPPGCKIYNSVELFNSDMEQRKTEQPYDEPNCKSSYNDAVDDFDPDLNELMD